MHSHEIILAIINGIVSGCLMMMGLYLILSKRSAFVTDVEPDQRLRTASGYNIIVWAGIYFLSILLNVKSAFSQEDIFFSNMAAMTDMLVVPSCIYQMFCLINRPTRVIKLFSILLIPALLALAYYCYDDNPILVPLVQLYWVGVGLTTLGYYLYEKQRFHNKLKGNFSDLEHKNINWINWFVFLFFCYEIVYVINSKYNNLWISILCNFTCLASWIFVLLRIDNQQCVIDFWATEEESTTQETEGQPQDSLSWIGKTLKEKCEEGKLFLQPDLNIDKLAMEIGTNRTYISRYINSNGMTYYEYINRLRIDYAKRLIDESDYNLSVSDIAIKSGYSSYSTFCRVFKSMEGVLPSKYKKASPKN